MRRLLIASVAAGSLTLTCLSGTALADPTPTRAQAEKALAQAQRVLDGGDVGTGRELTPLLTQVAAGRSKLRGSDQREARALLARPTEGANDPQGSGYAVPEATPYCTTDFCVHYVESTADAPVLTDADNDNVPDSVETIASEMQDTVLPTENGSGPGELNWELPPSDLGSADNGGDDRIDVYLKQLGTTDPTVGSLYGYAAPEVDDPNDQAQASYLVLDDDFAPAEYGNRPTDASRQATEAHEYNHVVQNGYDWLQDTWMAEATATWMEDQVYPDVNDYLGYLADRPKRWGACLATPLTRFDFKGTSDCGLKVYGSAVWNHWLSRKYSPETVRAVQEGSADADNFSIEAYDKAIKASGGQSFAGDFGEFAAATAEWNLTPGQDAPFPDAYPDLPRAGALTGDGPALPTQSLDNTTFRLFSVAPDASKPRYRLHADLPAGLAGGVALVGRTPQGEVKRVYGAAAASGSANATLESPGAYARITAVIVNADGTRATDENGDVLIVGDTFDWVYAKNAQPFSNVRVTSDTPVQPSPPVGPAPVGTTPAAPALTYRLSASARQKRSTVLKRGVSASLTCNRACSASATLTLDRATAKKLKLSRTIGKASTRLSKAGRKSFQVTLTRKARAALRKRARLKTTLTIRTKASSGPAKTAKRTITIVR